MFFEIESIYRSAIIDMKRRRARHPLSFAFIISVISMLIVTNAAIGYLRYFHGFSIFFNYMPAALLFILFSIILICAFSYLIYRLYVNWEVSIVRDFEEKTDYVLIELQKASKKDCLSVLNAELEMFNPYHALAWRNLLFIHFNWIFNVFGLFAEGEERIILAMTKVRKACYERMSELESSGRSEDRN
jgi:hypothetical protein